MEATRRQVLKGLAATLGFGALGGYGRLFAVPQLWKPGRTPNLVFGVISDTHLISSRRKREELMWTRTRHPFGNEKGRADKYLVSALEYFRERNVDAVMHCGDIADQGLVSEMEWTAAAWHRVFPWNRAPDGHEVVKLFVTGNHDVEGMWRVPRDYPDAAERARRMLNTDMAGHWERIWGEPFDDVWHKEVKGYHFFGRNFGEQSKAKFAQLLAAANAKFRLGDGARPFFIASHTGYAGRVNKEYRKLLKANLSNAVAFFGHHHWSLANWNRVYFDIRPDVPQIQCPPCNSSFDAPLGDSDAYIVPVRIEGTGQVGMARQGLVVSVFDDCVVFERRDFNIPGGSLGTKWVMPLGLYAPHPLSKGELKKAIGEPQFRKDAKLEVAGIGNNNDNIKNNFVKGARANPPAQSDKAEAVASAEKEVVVSSCSGCFQSIRIKIPLADGNPDSRVYAYEVVVVGDEGNPKLRKAIYAAGCNLAVGTEPNGGVTTLEIPASELPPGKSLTVAVRPITSLGTSGRPIITDFKV